MILDATFWNESLPSLDLFNPENWDVLIEAASTEANEVHQSFFISLFPSDKTGFELLAIRLSSLMQTPGRTKEDFLPIEKTGETFHLAILNAFNNNLADFLELTCLNSDLEIVFFSIGAVITQLKTSPDSFFSSLSTVDKIRGLTLFEQLCFYVSQSNKTKFFEHTTFKAKMLCSIWTDYVMQKQKMTYSNFLDVATREFFAFFKQDISLLLYFVHTLEDSENTDSIDVFYACLLTDYVGNGRKTTLFKEYFDLIQFDSLTKEGKAISRSILNNLNERYSAQPEKLTLVRSKLEAISPVFSDPQREESSIPMMPNTPTSSRWLSSIRNHISLRFWAPSKEESTTSEATSLLVDHQKSTLVDYESIKDGPR